MDEYFASQGDGGVHGKDREFYSQHLLEHDQRLFQSSQSSVELLSWPRDTGDGSVFSQEIDSSASLTSSLETLGDFDRRNFLYVIRQKCTWDNLRITRDLLLHILRLHQVFPHFLDCIHPFGFRMNDDNEVWEGCHRCCRWDSSVAPKILAYEIAYTYRYMARNGRKKGSEWSVRQTAVYQKLNMETKCSVWILVQPSEPVLKRFKAICLDLSGNDTRRHALPHLVFHNSAMEGWEGFLSYIRPFLQQLDEKACFARVGRTCVGDYDISFSDSQSLQRLRQKLFRSIGILSEYIKTVNICSEHYRDLKGALTDSSILSAQHNLDELSRSASYFKNVFSDLLQYSAGTAALLRQIPEYRLIEELDRNGKALNDNMLLLRDTANATQAGSVNMLEIAGQGREDAVLIKTLTRITILYLPATLIATIFSSNLVDSKPLNQVVESSRLVITPQFWIYVLVAIAFTIPTMAIPTFLERRQRRQRLTP
ncbi:hypothetical protein F4782DRAFT_45487 [Xylaria castorea]|nr:hypothetical protein F4782DRAFT_45487 [Xylaria castorea]